jgi:Phage integrase family
MKMVRIVPLTIRAVTALTESYAKVRLSDAGPCDRHCLSLYLSYLAFLSDCFAELSLQVPAVHFQSIPSRVSPRSFASFLHWAFVTCVPGLLPVQSELRKWQALCLDSEGHWLFPSPVTGRPYHADSIRTDYLVPTGLKLGLGRIGFHTFRHTYRAWLDETGAPVGVQQKLMRHAHVSTTMDQYGNASALAKRKANRPIVQRLLQRPANQEVSFQ